MRQKRAKVYRRLLHQYVLHYGFREPWQVLVDNSFAESLVRYKVDDPVKQLGNVLDGKIKPMITQCCMQALYSAEKGSEGSGHAQARAVVALAKSWERRMCNHKEALAPGDCLASVIGAANKHRYVLAADNTKVRRALRSTVPGLPIVHYSASVLVLEPMSSVTEEDIAKRQSGSVSAVSAAEQAILRKSEPGETQTQVTEPPPKRKRAKGPNPLSVKKPKKRAEPAPGPRKEKPQQAPDTGSDAPRRRRSKKRGSGSSAAD